MATTWYFTKEELSRGLSPEEQKTEITQRKATCSFLQEAGMKLRLPQLTIATAVIFFHRFYARYKFRDYDRYIIATTCLFLAGKVEETPKKLKDVIEVTYVIRFKGKEVPKPESQEFNQIKEQILTHELIVLQTIAFDLNVEHPYKYLLSYVKGIQGNRSLAQVAWNFVNDSLRTTLCLQHRPQLIASAAIYLASKFLKYQLPEGKKPWWEMLDARQDDLDAIGNQILDLYDSTPNVESVRATSSYFINDNDVTKNFGPGSTAANTITEMNVTHPSPTPTPAPTTLPTTASFTIGSSREKSVTPPLPAQTLTGNAPISSPSPSPLSANKDVKDLSEREKEKEREKREREIRDKERETKNLNLKNSSRGRSRSPRSRSSSRSRSRSPRSKRDSRPPARHESRDKSSSSSSRDRTSTGSSRSSSNTASNSRGPSSGSASRSHHSSSRHDDSPKRRYHPYE